eukprot:8535478-Pyramimonas_sp.AAC.1
MLVRSLSRAASRPISHPRAPLLPSSIPLTPHNRVPSHESGFKGQVVGGVPSVRRPSSAEQGGGKRAKISVASTGLAKTLAPRRPLCQ